MAEDLVCGCGRMVNWVAYDPLTGLSSCQHCRKQWVEQSDKVADCQDMPLKSDAEIDHVQ